MEEIINSDFRTYLINYLDTELKKTGQVVDTTDIKEIVNRAVEDYMNKDIK